MGHSLCPIFLFVTSVDKFCVVSGAAAGYGAQQTGLRVFSCSLTQRHTYTSFHTMHHTSVCRSSQVHDIAVYRGDCMSMAVLSVFSIGMTCIIDLKMLMYTL